MTEKLKPIPKKKREEALPERLLRRVLESMGDVVDRKFGRTVEPKSGLTTSQLIERMKRLIDERVRDEGRKGRIAPHNLKLKVEWGTHSEAPPEILKELEHEVLAEAIDHINDHRYRTLAPLKVETEVDIFTTGVSVDPTFGEFEEELKKEDEAKRAVIDPQIPKGVPAAPDVIIAARVTRRDGTVEVPLIFKPGGKRLNVGRASDNDLSLNDTSVSKIHATLLLNSEGTLLVADTGSTNGTYINGRRITYGEARQIEAGDVVGFGDVEVRFKRD
ncbi:MAG: FHA domain-containing protein [Pyrinomonadaceae bacterium]|nr:FHA domain-containing protein [Pyrinomonadaceae bacterium]MBA3568524.1 FHA domain-containing protein [Pyrinomonadaceae bacterium]MBA3571436.1 FHA domain-containing protein [Pyrinomonadaceae bacterium]MDQ3174214.1 FHA domain-containing protein [Acidobacteriota bacterium]